MANTEILPGFPSVFIGVHRWFLLRLQELNCRAGKRELHGVGPSAMARRRAVVPIFSSEAGICVPTLRFENAGRFDWEARNKQAE